MGIRGASDGGGSTYQFRFLYVCVGWGGLGEAWEPMMETKVTPYLTLSGTKVVVYSFRFVQNLDT